MVEQGWDEYRGWALRSRTIQAERRQWNTAALACAVAAAVLGAAAAVLGDRTEGKVVAALAAIASLATPLLGRYVLEVAGDASWIQARATAEALKAECFRFAGGVGSYGEPGAREAFIKRREDLVQAAGTAGAIPMTDADGAGRDKRRPPDAMDAAWYLDNRVREQQRFYARRQRELEAQIGRLRLAALGTALLSAACGALASTLQVTAFAPWVAVLTTVGALIVAHGAMERRQFLAASYGAMSTSLMRIVERYGGPGATLAALVADTESLLEGEHAAWVKRVTQTTAPPVTQPGAPNAAPAGG